MTDSSRFFGWRIVLLGLLLNAVGTGLIGVYAFMVTPLIEEFGATPAQLGLGMSIAVVSMTLASPLLGPIFDRGPLRMTMLAGVVLMLLALLLLSRGSALWQLAVCLPVAAIGIAMFGMLPAKVLIVNWFVRKRGKALAMAYAGTSVASFAMPPVAAWLIELTTWRGALAWIAIGAASIVAPAIAWLAIRRPEEIGEHPDGDSVAFAAPSGRADTADSPVRLLIRNPNFWLLGLGGAMALCVPLAASVFLVRHLEEIGVARTQVALVIPVMAVFSITGKLSVGVLADRMSPKLLILGAIGLHATGLALMAVCTTLESALWATIPMGLGGGGFIPLPGILQAKSFGRMMIGRVSGLHSLVALPFMLGVNPLVGLGATSTGGFVSPFLTLSGLQILAAGVIAFVRLPDHEPGHLPQSADSTADSVLVSDVGQA